jgi:hypothetical protein
VRPFSFKTDGAALSSRMKRAERAAQEQSRSRTPFFESQSPILLEVMGYKRQKSPISTPFRDSGQSSDNWLYAPIFDELNVEEDELNS